METNTMKDIIENLPKTREEARELGRKCYFTGEPCKNGHVDKRYTNTGICYACKRKRNKRDWQNHLERNRECSRKSYRTNQERYLAQGKKWAAANPEKARKIKKDYKIRHRNKYLQAARDYVKRKRKDPLYRLSRAMSKAVWAWLKGSKAFRHWEKVVGFTCEELKSSLELKFQEGMNWNNYGIYWEVDHVRPVSKCSAFQDAWNIDNLQPLTCSENRSKGNKWRDK